MTHSAFLKLAGVGLVGSALLGAPVPAQAQTQDAVALGTWTKGVPWDLSEFDVYNRQVGVVPQVVLWYQSWGPNPDGDFGPSLAEDLHTKGHSQVLTWEPKDRRYGKYRPDFSLRAISSGKHDDYIRGYARRVKSWGRLIHIRLRHEMNGDWYPWGTNVNGNKPAHFRSAWRHVVDNFRQERVSNVRWVWCPNVEKPVWNSPYPMKIFYRGHAYVDLVGLDGYNFGRSRDRSWFSFREVFGPSYEHITSIAPTKPVMLVETASDEAGATRPRGSRL